MIYGTERTKAEAVPKILADRKIVFPLLLDPDSTHREATRIAIYPSVVLVDHAGKVAWEGDPYFRKQFADTCEKRIEALLSSSSKR